MKEELGKPWIAWTYSDYGWHPHGFDTLKEAVAQEAYGSEKVITRGVVDWEASPLEK